MASGRAVGALAILLAWAFILFFEPVQNIIYFANHLRLPQPPSLTRLELTVALWVTVFVQPPLMAGPLVGYVAIVRPGRNPLRELGLSVDRRTPKELLIGIALGGGMWAILVGIAIVLQLFKVPIEEPSQLVLDIIPILRQQPALILLLPIAAGVGEEIAFRGFLQPRIGIIASSLLFGLVHLQYGTYLQVLVPALLGLAFAFIYAWRKVLWAPIAAHFFYDLIQLSLAAAFPDAAIV